MRVIKNTIIKVLSACIVCTTFHAAEAQTNAINATGWVGINTLTPQAFLDVKGNAKIGSDLDLTRQDGFAGGGYIVVDNNISKSIGIAKQVGGNFDYFHVHAGTSDFMGNLQVLNGAFHLQSNQPFFTFFKSDGLADSKRTSMYMARDDALGQEYFTIQFTNDAWTTGSNPFIIYRTGEQATDMLLNAQKTRIGWNSELLFDNYNMKVGINTAYNNKYLFKNFWDSGDRLSIAPAGSSPSYITFSTTDNGNVAAERMRIDYYGNVGIGTTDTKGYRFAVNGDAIFTRIKVKAYGNWPDYVFQNNYILPPLSEVEKFIQQHHHLPEVPAAAEVEKNGLDLGDNQALLLKKIEELTLYIIDQQKEIDQLKKEVAGMRKGKKGK